MNAIVKHGEEIPDEMILARLESGDKLTLARLAARLHMREEKVRKKLLIMVAQGKVIRERENASPNTPYLYYVDAAQTVIAGGAFEIPTPFVPVLMTGELKGYDAALSQRTALCMSIRRAA